MSQICRSNSRAVQVLAMILALHFLSACGSPLAGDQPGATDVTPTMTTASVNTLSLLSVAPRSSAVVYSGVLTLTVSGGIAPYAFSVLQGGGSVAVNGATGATFVAGTTSATVVIGITDATGSATTATVDVSATKSTH